MIEFKSLDAEKVLQAVNGTVLRGSVEQVGAVSKLGEPREVEAGGVAFVISESFLKDVAQTRASVLVVQESLCDRVLAELPAGVGLCIAAKDAYLGMAQLSKLIADTDPVWDWQLTGSAVIDKTAEISPSAKVAPGAVLCAGAKIGEGTTLLPNCVIGPQVTIGANCTIYPGVVVYPRTKIGNRVRIHANSVIGSDGFGYARGPQGSVKIWHLGRVVIGDDVEIGAGTMIDRGTIKDTVIERGAKIDNLVQIGHNGHVKAHAILCGQVGLAGNATVGQGTILAGKVGVADKIEVGDRVVVGPLSAVTKDIPPGETYMATWPSRPRREWWKLLAHLDRLPELSKRVKKLEEEEK